ncbi:MAG: hypothetical protein QHH06_14700 [Clostridiales bacterium]|nr:hypothetical protein [Eubacteriales bacterium]MDH7567689.1 hypothetical protein [Clostridiales bacterium]
MNEKYGKTLQLILFGQSNLKLQNREKFKNITITFSGAATRFTLSIALIITAAGYIFMTWGNNLMILTVGATIVGIGFGFVMPSITMATGALVPPAGMAFAMPLLIAFMSIGGFGSGFFFEFIMKSFGITSMRFPYLFGLICLTGFAVVYTLMNLKLKAPAQGASAGVGH